MHVHNFLGGFETHRLQPRNVAQHTTLKKPEHYFELLRPQGQLSPNYWRRACPNWTGSNHLTPLEKMVESTNRASSNRKFMGFFVENRYRCFIRPPCVAAAHGFFAFVDFSMASQLRVVGQEQLGSQGSGRAGGQGWLSNHPTAAW